jgi:hypothetical protein
VKLQFVCYDANGMVLHASSIRDVQSEGMIESAMMHLFRDFPGAVKVQANMIDESTTVYPKWMEEKA